MPSYGPIRCSFHNKIWMSSSLLCVSVNVVDPYLVVVSACLRVLMFRPVPTRRSEHFSPAKQQISAPFYCVTDMFRLFRPKRAYRPRDRGTSCLAKKMCLGSA